MINTGKCTGKIGPAIAIITVMALFSAGCTTSQDRRIGQDETFAKESLMLVFVRGFSYDARIDDIADEDRILECIRDIILRLRPSQPTVSFDRFRRVAFPGIQPESVPRNPEYLTVLFDSADFRETIAPLNLRYVVFVGGVIETSEAAGGAICGTGYGAAGCFAYYEWDKSSRIGATVLDLQNVQNTDRVSSSATGKAWFAIVGVFPIGLPSDPSIVACWRLGANIVRLLDENLNPTGR